MSTRANMNWFDTSLRRLVVVFSMAILLANLLPAHANAGNEGPGYERGLLEISLATTDDAQPNLLDGMPGHIASQCSCTISVLPQYTAQPMPHLVRPVKFAMTVSPFMALGAQAPPSEPPRS